jgi:hypothetical protein
MGVPEHSIVTFRLFGDDLIPAEVTGVLGCEPSESYAKGEVRIGSKSGNRYVEKTGRWKLCATDRSPEDVPAQIREILGNLTQDMAVWEALKKRYTLDMFCGIFMASSNDGLEFPPDVLEMLATRGIALALDIYDPSDD